MPPSYNSREYWDGRFAEESSFDWLVPTSTAESPIVEQIKLLPNGKHAEILHIGCGNSDLSHSLTDIVHAYASITNVDFSGTVIEATKEEASRPKAVPYLLSTKTGTDPAVFGNYLQSISKVNEGPMPYYPNVPWQSQVINLTAEEAKDAAVQPFMYFVSLVTEPPPEDENGRPIPGLTKQGIRTSTPREERVRWIASDLLSLDDIKAKLLLPPDSEAPEANSGCYNLIIDKSTTDSIACGEDITITLPYPPGDNHNPSSAPEISQAAIHPIHLLALHLALLAPRQESRWLVFSHSEHRFPFLESSKQSSTLYGGLADGPLSPEIVEAGFPDTSKLWRMEAKWSIETSKRDDEDSAKGKEGEWEREIVYRPPDLCWVYVLVRK